MHHRKTRRSRSHRPAFGSHSRSGALSGATSALFENIGNPYPPDEVRGKLQPRPLVLSSSTYQGGTLKSPTKLPHGQRQRSGLARSKRTETFFAWRLANKSNQEECDFPLTTVAASIVGGGECSFGAFSSVLAGEPRMEQHTICSQRVAF